MNTKIAVLLIAVIGVSSVAGTAAFTTGQVDRTATVQVAGDDAALTGLAPGASDLVYYDGNNELQIDFSQVTADGVNANSTYTVGDTGAANETYAFNVTNNHNTQYQYTFDYVFDNTNNAGNVSFLLYDNTGTQVDTASPGSTGSISLAAGEVGYVVIELDAASTDLSGTLSVSIS
ncbi:hypothetical protein GCM10027435_01240 [Haloparvum alkalitolerans]|uniref:hypothetical protein n=1 Tax=Haloparvum alkalitolerans TaxID=1042953 RepID=UPI003CE8B8CF